MDMATFRHQVELAEFPAGVEVSAHPEGPGWRLRAQAGSGGLELLLTDGAAEMYGDGPALSAALSQLRRQALAGLPEAHPDGTLERLVFVAD